ncbi:Molecular chaperone HtpG [Aphelenchoides fujianensis]|nr:Molecular chaperone HtpG [Aphelenchoides fujianensis]
MSLNVDDFERKAALRIDGSRKTIQELIVELRTMLESRLYIGEEVRFFESVLNLHIGRVIDCIELQTAHGVQRKYTVLCRGKLHKNLAPAQLKRTREVSDVDLRNFIQRTASQSFVTQVWSLKEGHWEFYEYALTLNTYICWKRTKETWDKEKKISDNKAGVAILLLMSPFLLLAGAIMYDCYNRTGPLPIEQPNIRFAEDALESMREMNETTSDHFWKRLSTDEKINLADPSALEGIAHLFVFKSSRSNRTTLREYVDRMLPDPPAIFFTFSESAQEFKKLPAARSLIESGREILLLTDPLDRKALQTITWFEGKTLMDARWYEQSRRTDGRIVD